MVVQHTVHNRRFLGQVKRICTDCKPVSDEVLESPLRAIRYNIRLKKCFLNYTSRVLAFQRDSP
jgi:hypothetical protein